MWAISSGSSTACFSIHIIRYFGWCQSPFSHSFAAVEHTFWGHPECTEVTHWLTDRPTLKSRCINGLRHLEIKAPKRKIKQTWGKANVGMISFTNGDSLVKEKSKVLLLVHDLFIPLNHVKAPSHLWYLTKTFHLLFLLTFFTFTILHYSSFEIINLTHWHSYRKVLSILSTFPHIILSHSFFLLPSSYESLHVASLLQSNENNSWLIVLGWHNGLVYTAGGLSTDRRSHLCWVGLGLIEISSTNTSPAFVWGMCCVIRRLKQTTLHSSFEELWVKY